MNQARKKNDLSTIIIVALLLMVDAVCNEILSASLFTLPCLTAKWVREREKYYLYEQFSFSHYHSWQCIHEIWNNLLAYACAIVQQQVDFSTLPWLHLTSLVLFFVMIVSLKVSYFIIASLALSLWHFFSTFFFSIKSWNDFSSFIPTMHISSHHFAIFYIIFIALCRLTRIRIKSIIRSRGVVWNYFPHQTRVRSKVFKFSTAKFNDLICIEKGAWKFDWGSASRNKLTHWKEEKYRSFSEKKLIDLMRILCWRQWSKENMTTSLFDFLRWIYI